MVALINKSMQNRFYKITGKIGTMYLDCIQIEQKLNVKNCHAKVQTFFFGIHFQQDKISVSRHLRILEINCSLMINYSKNENSRSFAWKIGAKILAIAKRRDFMTREITPSRFLNHNSQISEGNFLRNGLTLTTIEPYFRFEKGPYFA